MSAISSAEAFKQLKANKLTKWPGADSQRIYEMCQPGITPKFNIEKTDRVFTIGSCFARNIEIHLAEMGMEVPTLGFKPPTEEKDGAYPNGMLNKFTPPEISQELVYAANGNDFIPAEKQIIEIDGGKCFDLHLAAPVAVTRERALERRGEVRDLFRSAFDSEVIIITLGLIESWIDNEHNVSIFGMPRQPIQKKYPDRFSFEVLDFQRCSAEIRKSIDLLIGTGVPKKILLTVSPVPLQRTFTSQDVVIANMYSKSVLRVVAQEVCRDYDNVDYFPSFESIQYSSPDLAWKRDYRHVTDFAVGVNVARMLQTFFAPGSIDPKMLEDKWKVIDETLSDFREKLKKQGSSDRGANSDPKIEEIISARVNGEWKKLDTRSTEFLSSDGDNVQVLRHLILAKSHLGKADDLQAACDKLLAVRDHESDQEFIAAAKQRCR